MSQLIEKETAEVSLYLDRKQPSFKQMDNAKCKSFEHEQIL